MGSISEKGAGGGEEIGVGDEVPARLPLLAGLVSVCSVVKTPLPVRPASSEAVLRRG